MFYSVTLIDILLQQQNILYKYRLQSAGKFSQTERTQLATTKWKLPRAGEMPPRETMCQMYPDMTTPELVDDSYLSVGELKEAFRLDRSPSQYSPVMAYIDQTLRRLGPGLHHG